VNGSVPPDRLAVLVDRPLRADGELVLYWMIGARRPRYNFALQRAAALARETGRPLVVLEALRCGYRWASDRMHRFALDGMAANRDAFAGLPVTYYPYVEPSPGHGAGLLRALSQRAVAIVTDHQPGFFLPRMVAAAAEQVSCRFEQVDGVGLMPLAATPRAFARAVDLRRHLQKNLRPHLDRFPRADPLEGGLPAPRPLPAEVLARWPAAQHGLLDGDPAALAALPIDHGVGAVRPRGGWRAAEARWRRFLTEGLPTYADARRDIDDGAQSGLAPYLHFGHISVHQLMAELAERHAWTPDGLAPKATGSRSGWWGLPEGPEGFLDELITWRELGHGVAHHEPDTFATWASVPAWARQTLADHAGDPRQVLSFEQLEAAATPDPIWNAAQRQLLREGRIHNYLRMLWGKNVLAWSATPEAAAARLVELNNRYALDGRDANSYSGIYWVFGRHDRAWGPERPIYGKVRYMTSANTARKLRLGPYLERYGR
jgi:deoxyribodipyrimidine photo-lyase